MRLLHHGQPGAADALFSHNMPLRHSVAKASRESSSCHFSCEEKQPDTYIFTMYRWNYSTNGADKNCPTKDETVNYKQLSRDIKLLCAGLVLLGISAFLLVILSFTRPFQAYPTNEDQLPGK
jgi:hypothetical protein